MEEKAVSDTVIVESDLKTELNKEQAHHIAFNIVFDIIDYIKNNQEEYLKYLDTESK